MARGRKGPPQDSIDSILLAISRRDTIDPDTMSHYFDRLDEEWAEGARDKVMHLLRSGDPLAHSAAVLILSELATDFDLEELEDFVTDPTVADMAKLSLSPILKELGSEMADDGIIEYLNDPASAVQQMQARLLELVGQSEIGVESILEDVISMPVDRRLAFIGWLGSSNDPRAANLLIPLLENQASKVVTAVIEALEQLGPIAVQQTIPALNYLISTSSNRQLKQQARTVLGRLTMQSMLGTEDAAMNGVHRSRLPVHEARVSFIDGSGAQLIMLSWRRPDGSLKGINVLYQDQWGIKDCYGIDDMDAARWDELVSDLNEQGFGSFQVPFEYGRALIMEARALSKRTHHKLPVAYAIWRPLIEVEDTAHPPSSGKQKGNGKLPTTTLDPRLLDAEAIALAQHGEELYQLSECISWMYEPASRLEPYVTRYWNSFDPEFQGRRSRRNKGKQQERSALLETLVDEALGDGLIDEQWRLLYEGRLRRQAALLQFAEREQDAELASAVAAVLHPSSTIPPQEQHFLRAMMRLSIEQGPLRMMVESLGSGNLTTMPINLFGDQ